MPLPISEALANLRHSLGFGLILFFVSLLGGAGLIVASTLEAEGYAQDWQQGVQAGRFVFTVASTESGTVDASRCDALNVISGVIAAGAITAERDIAVPQTGSRTWREVTVTPRFPAVAWPDGPPPFPGTGAIFPNELATLLGAVAGSTFSVIDRDTEAQSLIQVEWISAQRSRIDGINRDLIRLGGPFGVAKVCYVSTEPAAFLDVGAVARGWFGEPVQVSELGTRSEGGATVIAPARTMDWGWSIVLIPVVILTLSWWFARRADLALYRLLGLTKTALITMVTTEWALLVLVPTSLGAAVTVTLFHPIDTYVIASISLDLLRYMAALAPLPLVALVIGRRSNTVRALSGF